MRLFLDHDRSDSDGFLIATMHESSDSASYTLDSSALKVHAGDYFVRVEVDDGANAPFSCYSDDTIKVVPGDAPDPVTDIQFLPDDGAFHISWTPSTETDLLGYLVLFKDAAEDLGLFNQRRFVSTDAVNMGVTVDGLENDEALLVTVVAVDEEHRRSYPADIVRIIPHAPGDGSVPHIVSTPDTNATATYAYNYLPTMSDVDFGTYVWSLDAAPGGMAIDADCGLVTWTPAEDQEGPNDVTIRLTKNGDGVLSNTQSFSVHVYPPEQMNGLSQHAYQVASSPVANTTDAGSYAGKQGSEDGTGGNTVPYEYQVSVHGPTDDLYFELAAGPDGMTIDPDTGLISWDVPEGAKGAWIRVLITAEGQHRLDHDFYLHVHRDDHFPSPDDDDDPSCPCSWRILFGCRGSGAGSDSYTDGLGEFAVLAAAIALAWLVGTIRTRRRQSEKSE